MRVIYVVVCWYVIIVVGPLRGEGQRCKSYIISYFDKRNCVLYCIHCSFESWQHIFNTVVVLR